MNELPERDDAMIRRLLKESGVDESPELLDGLRKLRSFSGAAAPAPTGELAELLSESARDRSKPPRRHRGLILSFTLAAAMAAGASGVAASTITDLRLASESVTHAEMRDASPVEEDSGQETDADSESGPAAPVSPSTAEAVDPEAVSPEATPAAPESGAETGAAEVGVEAGKPAAPPAPPAPPANLPDPAAPAGSIPAPSADAAPGPAARTAHPAEAGCGHDHGGPGDPGKPEHPGGHGKPEQPGSQGRDRGAGDAGRPGEPGRDTGGGPRHGNGENPGKQPHNPGQKFSETNRAPGNP